METSFKTCIVEACELQLIKRLATGTGNTESSFISQQTSATHITLKLFVPYLQTTETRLTAECMVYVKLQIEQLNAQHSIYVISH